MQSLNLWHDGLLPPKHTTNIHTDTPLVVAEVDAKGDGCEEVGLGVGEKLEEEGEAREEEEGGLPSSLLTCCWWCSSFFLRSVWVVWVALTTTTTRKSHLSHRRKICPVSFVFVCVFVLDGVNKSLRGKHHFSISFAPPLLTLRMLLCF